MCASATTTNDKINYLESYILIWLNDTNSSPPFSQRRMQEELQDTINCQKTFDDLNACREFIHEKNCEYVIIVSNEKFAEKLVLMTKQEEKIRTVYIYYEDEKSKSELSVFQNNIVLISIDELVEKIKINQRRRERYEDPISFNCMDGDRFYGDRSSSMYSFMPFELLLDVILRTEQPNEMDELIRLCKIEYHDNEVEKRRIDLFQQTYTAETSIRWFTKDSFVYRLLNKALRLQNIEILLAFRFLIKDLHQQLTILEKDRTISNMKVFRGQILPSADLARMKRSSGKLISFHSFISASLEQDLAISFAASEPSHPDLVNVLFEIECDQCSSLSLTPRPYADISKLSEISTEKEVLFSLGSYFRITGIDYDTRYNVNIIKLVSLSDTQAFRRSSYQSEIFLDLQTTYQEYRRLYEDTITQLSNDEFNGLIYIIAGNAAREQGKYELSLEHLEKALGIYCSIYPRGKKRITLIKAYIYTTYKRIIDYNWGYFNDEERTSRLKSMMEMDGDLSVAEYGDIWNAYDRYFQRESRFYRPAALMYNNENFPYREAFGIQFYEDKIDIMINSYQRMLSIASKIRGDDGSKITRLFECELWKLFYYRRNGW